MGVLLYAYWLKQGGYLDITCISDLHGEYPELLEGDLLIVAGDLTAMHSLTEFNIFCLWIADQKYAKKIVIGGNHDNFFENDRWKLIPHDFTYLQDSGCEYKGFKIWGSPWTKKFYGQNPGAASFSLMFDDQMKEKWDKIPDDVDILITHTPPFSILDSIPARRANRVGCTELLKAYERIKPQIHVFGHLHKDGGKSLKRGDTRFFNCAHMNEDYDPVNKPHYIRLEEKLVLPMEVQVMDSQSVKLDQSK